MKKVVLFGTSVYGVENFGDEAILSTLTRSLHANVDDLEITLFARHPGEYLDTNFNLVSYKNIEHDSKAKSLGKWFFGLNPDDPSDHLKFIIEKMKKADIVIIGGDPFAEIVLGVYRGLISYAALVITLAKFLGKRVVLYGIHMGRPIQTEYGQELSRFIITNTDLMTVREQFSVEILKEMNTLPKNVSVLADPAFGLDPVYEDGDALAILKKEGIKLSDRPLVGINFRYHYWEWKAKDWIPYRDMVAAFCDYIVSEKGADVIFIPNCTYDLDHKYEDDRPGAAEIVEQMQYKKWSHQIQSKYTLFETFKLFHLLDAHYSSRRHSLCFAAIHGVPILGSGAAGKWHISPIFDELEVPEYFLSNEDLTLETLKEKFDELWDNRENIHGKLVRNSARLHELALQHGKVIADFMSES